MVLEVTPQATLLDAAFEGHGGGAGRQPRALPDQAPGARPALRRPGRTVGRIVVLCHAAGEVIGVTNMGYIFFGGLGFAIPVDYVKHFIDNRDAFAYDKDNPNTGFRYIQPDGRRNKGKPKIDN